MENVLVVLNFNDYLTTEEFIKCVGKYKILDKIIIVDNKSTDGSKDKLCKYVNDKIDLIVTEKNGGYSYGNNYGVKYAINKYSPNNIIISNPDIIVEEKTIKNLINYLNKNKDVAITTGKMLNKDLSISKGIAWKLPKYKDDLILASIILNKIFKPLEYDNRVLLANRVNEVDVVPGSFFIIKANIMREINYFDEDTFLYCEERILAYKLKKKGYKTILISDEEFIHNHSVSINKNISSYFKRYDILRDSKIIYMKKYLKVSQISIKIFKLIHNMSKIEKWILQKIK